MWNVLKRIAAFLPPRWQQHYRRYSAGRAMRALRNPPGEPEMAHLGDWVATGDWVLDVGANIGLYTTRLSAAVGPEGRVFAFEPIPETFEVLSAVVAQLPLQNVTLINAAISSRTNLVRMEVPKFRNGLADHYEAHISETAPLSVLGLAIDTLELPQRVALIKIDVEGHEDAALTGMQALIRRDRPVLIVEANGRADALLLAEGYHVRVLPGSSNRVYEPSH